MFVSLPSFQLFFRAGGESWSLICRGEHRGWAGPCARPGLGWEPGGHGGGAPRQPPAPAKWLRKFLGHMKEKDHVSGLGLL